MIRSQLRAKLRGTPTDQAAATKAKPAPKRKPVAKKTPPPPAPAKPPVVEPAAGGE